MKRLALLTSAFLFSASGSALMAQSAGVRLPEYSEVRLPNGMQILLMERHDVPLIAFSARVRGGQLSDPAGKEGTADVVAELLQRGAGSRDARAFAESVDSVGGIINTAATRESLVISGEFMSRDRDLMVGLLADMLRRPMLPAAEFEKARQREIESLAAAKDGDPSQLMASYFYSLLYGSHPYGRQSSEASYAAIGHEDVRRYLRDETGADRTVLAVVGDFRTSDMEQAMRRAFGDWSKAGNPAPQIRPARPLTGRRVLLVDKPDATQTYFWIGNLGVARNDPDRVAIDLANTAFGGRFTSMLNTELRVKSGLTYGARSTMIETATPGIVAITSFTRTDATTQAIDMAVDLLRDLRRSGLDEPTIASVKAYVKGQFAPDLETGTQLATKLSEIAFYGLDRSDVDSYFTSVDAATLPAVKKVIERVYPDPDNLTFVLIGNAAAIREAVARYGPVTEMKITDPTFVAPAPAEVR